MAFQGLYDEAQAKDDADLEIVLKGYEKVLMENPVNVVSECISIRWSPGARF
jgi:hypothetical protein